MHIIESRSLNEKNSAAEPFDNNSTAYLSTYQHHCQPYWQAYAVPQVVDNSDDRPHLNVVFIGHVDAGDIDIRHYAAKVQTLHTNPCALPTTRMHYILPLRITYYSYALYTICVYYVPPVCITYHPYVLYTTPMYYMLPVSVCLAFKLAPQLCQASPQSPGTSCT